jgi:HK97 gp10 family phage protein
VSNITITGLDDVNRVLQAVAPSEAKNLMRATIYDIAKQGADTGRAGMPEQSGNMKAATKPKRKNPRQPGELRATVEVNGAFYWRFQEYGQGPDGVEHAMFLKAINEIKGDLANVFLKSFTAKLVKRLARENKRIAKAGG